jgi:Rgg/GadR/MutR family transcriptional activator
VIYIFIKNKNKKKYISESEGEKFAPRKYGEVFREFREMKGYSVTQAHRGDCDRKTLWNFEIGGTRISLEIFIKLLKNINVSETEFFAAVNRYCLSKNEMFFEKVCEYYANEDIPALKEMLEKQKKDHINIGTAEQNWNIFVLSGLINNLDSSFVVSEQVIEASLDYLLEIESWQTCDLLFFSFVVHFVNIRLSCSIVKSLIESGEIFRSKNTRRIRFINLLINTAHDAIEKNCLIEAKNFIDVIKMLFPQQKWASWNLLGEQYAFKFLEGELKFACGDEAGKIQMMEVINHLSFLGNENLKRMYQKCLNNFISCK